MMHKSPLTRAFETPLAAARLHGLWCRAHPVAAGLLWTFLLSLVLMATVDKPLALYLKRHVDGHVEGFFKVITEIGWATWWYLLGGLATLVCLVISAAALTTETHDRFRHHARAWAFLFTATLSSGLLVTVLKQVFGRHRPRDLFNQGIYGFDPLSFGGANSFPSGHSQAIVAAMAALCVLFPRHWPWWVVTAVMVTASRVVTTVHFLSDTLMGAMIGLAAVLLLRPLFERGGFSLRVGREN